MRLVFSEVDGATVIGALPVRFALWPVTTIWWDPFAVVPIAIFFDNGPLAGAVPDASTLAPIAMAYFSAGSSPVTVTDTEVPWVALAGAVTSSVFAGYVLTTTNFLQASRGERIGGMPAKNAKWPDRLNAISKSAQGSLKGRSRR